MAKHAACAGAGAVGFFNALCIHMAHEIFVGRGDGVGGCGRTHKESLKGLLLVSARPAGPWQSQLSHLNEHLDGN